ncbi:hypothetical protein GQ44DRAFT_613465 [Phaeosphaeriaceae sp. PMI808]|nr:hypothetical protein GQ44DRAFT_613465 [Phaeosphaeriaceae sp. PMI808]
MASKPGPPPFTVGSQLIADPHELSSPGATTLPGHPYVNIDETAKVEGFLKKDIFPHDLESVANRLWILSTQSSKNISPLHHQRIKGRSIFVTEDPRLHLVWIHDHIFVKPLPEYLLSHGFWVNFLDPSSSRLVDCDRIRRAALGYLRTYRFLIQYQSDLQIAQQENLQLVPRHITWSAFTKFIVQLEDIDDSKVSGRYNYGELRLARLNFYAPFLFGRFHFEEVSGEYSNYFSRFYGPILFGFASLSTILNSMQVELAVEQLMAPKWPAFWVICRWFSTIGLVLVSVLVLCLVGLWSILVLDEWVYAVKDRLGTRRRRREASKC